MNEDFATFELAKKLKEKGFTCEIPFAMYNELGVFHLLTTSAPYNVSSSGYKYREYYDYDDFDEHDCVAPTISQVLKWLREEKNIFVLIDIRTDLSFFYEIWCIEIALHPMGCVPFQKYQSYEQAAIAGIEYVINNFI